MQTQVDFRFPRLTVAQNTLKRAQIIFSTVIVECLVVTLSLPRSALCSLHRSQRDEISIDNVENGDRLTEGQRSSRLHGPDEDGRRGRRRRVAAVENKQCERENRSRRTMGSAVQGGWRSCQMHIHGMLTSNFTP